MGCMLLYLLLPLKERKGGEKMVQYSGTASGLYVRKIIKKINVKFLFSVFFFLNLRSLSIL